MKLMVKYAVYGQVCFYLGLLICILIRPEGLGANGGISYYANYRETIIPFLFMVIGSAYFLFRLARNLKESEYKPLRYALYLISVLALGIAATPVTDGRIVADAHNTVGCALFITQLFASGWLARRHNFSRTLVLLTALEVLAGIAGLIYLSPPEGFLLQAEAIFQASFGAIIIFSLISEIDVRNTSMSGS